MAAGTEVFSKLEQNDPATAAAWLGWKSIGVSGLFRLMEALKTNTVCVTLSLQSNEIGDEGACALAEFLKENKTIKHIDLFKNNIGPRGAIALAEMLKLNDTLENLSFQTNKIEFEGVTALADALQFNGHLKILILHACELDDPSAIVIVEALAHNSTLVTLFLDSNPRITNRTGDAVVALLSVNIFICEIHLRNTSISESKQREIDKLIKDPAREGARGAIEADTKPAKEIPLEHRD
eukprot:m.200918 g.200918  ORF g.200918 m.200918 type:complete len:238 (+) comp15500_c1_seq16:2072-2785(+)